MKFRVLISGEQIRKRPTDIEQTKHHMYFFSAEYFLQLCMGSNTYDAPSCTEGKNYSTHVLFSYCMYYTRAHISYPTKSFLYFSFCIPSNKFIAHIMWLLQTFPQSLQLCTKARMLDRYTYRYFREGVGSFATSCLIHEVEDRH